MNEVRQSEILRSIHERTLENGWATGQHAAGDGYIELIIVPWLADAVTAPGLVEALREALGGVLVEREPAVLPHGRRVWHVQIPGVLRLVLNVMAPATEEHDASG